MRQIELTTRLNSTLEDALKILKKQDFKKIKTIKMKDIYMTPKAKKLKKNNILEVLSSCVLLRDNNMEEKTITYKNKAYDGNTLLTEEKIDVVCYDLEFALQDVKGLGILMEYENLQDFDKANEEKKQIKKIKNVK